MPHVVEINRIEQLEDLRLVWRMLLNGTDHASLFHTLDWLQVYWRHFGMDQKLRVLVVYAGELPIGILPLTVVPERTRAGTVRVLTYPLHDWGTFFGPIGPNPTATLTLALRHISSTPRDWDLIDLRWIDRDAADHGRTPWALRRAGFSNSESEWKATSLVELSGDWDGYWQSLSSKMRNNLRRDQRRLQEAGQVEYIRFRPIGSTVGDNDPRWDLYDRCLEVAEASWQGASVTGTTLSHVDVAAYFRDAHRAAVENGMVDVNLLLVNGRAVAFAYNYVCDDGELIGARRGHLPAFARCGAGNVLFARMLQDSFARGDRQLDLGPGSTDIKRRWCNRTTSSYRYTHYPLLAPRAQLLRLKHWTSTHFGSTPVSTSM